MPIELIIITILIFGVFGFVNGLNAHNKRKK